MRVEGPRSHGSRAPAVAAQLSSSFRAPPSAPSIRRMRLPFFWIDAFTDRVFSGNPAGVCPLEAWPDDAVMQKMAWQHGLSETAFFVPVKETPSPTAPRYHLRWFSPPVEVDLCGHATLATAHVLFHELGIDADAITFDSRSGPLVVRRAGNSRLELDFPATPPVEEADTAFRSNVAEALGAAPRWVGRTRFDTFVALADAAAVRALQPDFARVAAIGGRGVIVTAPGDDGGDFVSRFFAPQTGIPEDPVTGSAHCALVPFWAQRFGKTQLHARQVSLRGGELWCTLAGERVLIAGRAATYLRGEIALSA